AVRRRLIHRPPVRSSTRLRTPMPYILPSRPALAVLALLAAALSTPPVHAQAADTGRVVERGRFRLHKFAQEIGAETYEIRDLGSTLVVRDSFQFTDRGTAVPLTATLRLRPDLTPVGFAVKGNTARGSTIDDEVTVAGGNATVREGSETRQAAVP